MNNRKPRNRRGKFSRQHYEQFAPEPKNIRLSVEEPDGTRKTLEIPNPKFGSVRRIVHNITKTYEKL